MSVLSPNHTFSSIDTIVNMKTAPASTPKSAKKSKTAANMAVSHAAKPKTASAKASKANAAAAATTTIANVDATKQKSSQMHRRSRTGCYTCRLRRKKCDEGTPLCTACKHLGLTCEYKRPHWWGNNDARRNQKDDIKMIIKRKKLSEKAASSSMHTSVVGSPPGLSLSSLSSASLPASATFSDPLDRTRSASIDSHYAAAAFDFNSPPTSASEYGGVLTSNGDTTSSAFSTPQMHPDFMFGSGFAPYEVDIKTERQMFVNDVPTLHESTTSTFSTYHTPPPPGTVLPPYPMVVDGALAMDPMAAAAAATVGLGMTGLGVDPQTMLPMPPVVGTVTGATGVTGAGGEWMEQVYSERRESMTEETLNMNFFDFPHATSRQVAIELDEGDKYLLDHFVQYVLPTIFPILESNQHGSVGSDLILPALQSNKCYLHCCLSVAAQHLKAVLGSAQAQAQVQGQPGQLVATPDLDADIMRHRYATISALCHALPRDENHQQVLESALALIFFQCGVGRFDDALPDVPWHQHCQAAASLVQKLNLPAQVTAATTTAAMTAPTAAPEEASPTAAGDAAAAAVAVVGAEAQQTPFNMTLMSWVDILGATMQGRAPVFAHTYREKHLSPPHLSSLGLRELMGCEDRIMYLISEIACLEALKASGMDDIMLCHHVSVLGDQIGLTEVGEAPAKLPFNANGSLSPKQLSKNMTAAFRLAARIYLCSLVPGFCPSQASCRHLVDKLTAVLQTIPCGPAGFDRCVVWVYLMAGFASMPGSTFRVFFEDRIVQMGDNADVGSFGRVVSLLHEVWLQQNVLIQQIAEDQEHVRLQILQRRQQRKAAAASSSLSSSPSSPLPHGAEDDELEPMLPPQYVHWREVMHMKGWDFLLI
ncbi:DNA-binding transcriptional regulator ume6 [Sporothrix curviconia]|uniref:DNA-binding transcriptional regulator ume6 n=1 Tax=Sporothrix curviconia TaxID=1260050 RepID=A0ABP0B8B7_9PEZI